MFFLIFTTEPEKGNFLLSWFSGLFPAVLGTEPHITPVSFSIQAVLTATLCIFLVTFPPISWLVICIWKQENGAFILFFAFAQEGKERRDTPQVMLGLSSCIIFRSLLGLEHREVLIEPGI